MAEDRTESFLAGRAIVIVDRETSNYDLFAELKLRGAEVTLIPRLQVAELEKFERLDEAIDHLYGYDWLLFMSVTGVEFFLRHLQRKGLDAGVLDELKVCAIGDDVEKLLREKRVHVDVVPPSSGKKDVFASLEQFVGGPGALAGLNFLSPRATSAPDSLARILSDSGARIDLVPTYRVTRPDGEAARTAALIRGAADCIVLTSPESLRQLALLFDTHDLSEMLSPVSVLSLDEETARMAMEYELRVRALPAQASITEVLQTIEACILG